jgi:hypothetical protein
MTTTFARKNLEATERHSDLTARTCSMQLISIKDAILPSGNAIEAQPTLADIHSGNNRLHPRRYSLRLHRAAEAHPSKPEVARPPQHSEPCQGLELLPSRPSGSARLAWSRQVPLGNKVR